MLTKGLLLGHICRDRLHAHFGNGNWLRIINYYSNYEWLITGHHFHVLKIAEEVPEIEGFCRIFFLQVLLIGDAFCRFICGPSKGLNFPTKFLSISQNRNKLGAPGISTTYARQAGRITLTKPSASSFSVNSGSMMWDVGLNSFANLNLLKFCSKSHIALMMMCVQNEVSRYCGDQL